LQLIAEISFLRFRQRLAAPPISEALYYNTTFVDLHSREKFLSSPLRQPSQPLGALGSNEEA